MMTQNTTIFQASMDPDFATEKAKTTESERDVDDLSGYRSQRWNPLTNEESEEWLKKYGRNSKLKKKASRRPN